MSKLAFDYSKWDNIEISDDEADTHPNIDKASWFRMKHRSRVEREETEQMEKTAMEKENKADGEREREIVRLLAEVRSGGDAAEYEDEDALVGELEEVLWRCGKPSRHRRDSCPSDEVVGGFFFYFEPFRTASRDRDDHLRDRRRAAVGTTVVAAMAWSNGDSRRSAAA